MVPSEDKPKPSLESSDPIGELERLAKWFKSHGNEEKAREILSQLEAVRSKYTSKDESGSSGKTS